MYRFLSLTFLRSFKKCCLSHYCLIVRWEYFPVSFRHFLHPDVGNKIIFLFIFVARHLPFQVYIWRIKPSTCLLNLSSFFSRNFSLKLFLCLKEKIKSKICLTIYWSSSWVSKNISFVWWKGKQYAYFHFSYLNLCNMNLCYYNRAEVRIIIIENH